MKWYFAINQNGMVRYAQMIAAACNSALRNSDLQPNLLYDGEETEFTGRLRAAGVMVHRTQVSFLNQLVDAKPGGSYNPEVARGAYLRLEVANIEQQDPFVLYTDVDVLFQTGFISPADQPRLFSACTEIWTGGQKPAFVETVFNSGVMLINVAALRKDYMALVDFVRNAQFYFHGKAGFYDQGALNAKYAGLWDKLDARYNVRPFAGSMDEAFIVHCHGIKPYEIEYMMAGKHDQVPEIAKKLYYWATDDYAALLSMYRQSVPDWFWDLKDYREGRLLGVSPVGART